MLVYILYVTEGWVESMRYGISPNSKTRSCTSTNRGRKVQRSLGWIPSEDTYWQSACEKSEREIHIKEEQNMEHNFNLATVD